MAEGLRERLIGAWKLVSYQEVPVDGSDDRPNFASGDWFAGTPEDYQQEAPAGAVWMTSPPTP
jgi:hypothetical protein